MLKRFFYFYLVLTLGSFYASAQTTTLTGTIVDSDGIAWGNGTWSATLNNPRGGQITYLDGYTGPVISNVSGSLDGTGTFTTTLSDNSQLAPAGTNYTIKFCPNASVACSYLANQTVTGSSFNISSTATTQINPPRFAATGANAYGYSDIEINTAPVPGAFYWNVVSLTQRQWNGSIWQAAGGGGGSSGTGIQIVPESGSTSANGRAGCSTPAITSLTNGLLVGFQPTLGANNSPTPSLNLCGLGAKTIVGPAGIPLQSGDINNLYNTGTSGPQTFFMSYNSSTGFFELQNPLTGPGLSIKASGPQPTPNANMYYVENFPSTGGVVDSVNASSTNMTILAAAGNTITIYNSPGFDSPQFSAGKYLLKAGTYTVTGGTVTIPASTTISAISYSFQTATGTITLNNALTTTGTPTGTAAVTVTPGIYAGTYTTAFDYACATANLYNQTSNHNVTVILGGGSHTMNQSCIVLGNNGTGVSFIGQNSGGIISRSMAFGKPQQGTSSSQSGSILKMSGSSNYPVLYYANNSTSRYSAKIESISIDNTAGLAEGCSQFDGVTSVIQIDFRCSDESSGTWDSLGYGETGLYNDVGYSTDFDMFAINVTRGSTNSSSSFSENSQLSVTASGGTVTAVNVVAGGTVTSDDQVVFTGYSTYAGGSNTPCSILPLAALTVTGKVIYANPHTGQAGINYKAGDVVTVQQSGSSNTATLTVLSVNSTTGAVISFSANSTTSSAGGSNYTGTSFTGNVVGTPLATTGGSGTGLYVDALVLGPATAITVTSGGSGCNDPAHIYAQILRPSLTGGTFTPTSGNAGMNFKSTSDSHLYNIQLQVDGNVGFRVKNHGGNKCWGCHIIGVGGLGGALDDEWGGQQYYEFSSDTVNLVPFTINPTVGYNQTVMFAPTILFNATWAPFPGAIGFAVGNLANNNLQVTNLTCGTNGQQAAGGYVPWLGPNGPIDPSYMPLSQITNVQECGTAPPQIVENYFNNPINMVGQSTAGVPNSIIMNPVAPATLITQGNNSIPTIYSSAVWNNANATSQKSSWQIRAFNNGTTGSLEELRNEYIGGGLTESFTSGLSTIGVNYNEGANLATSAHNVPAPYYQIEGQALNSGGISSACYIRHSQLISPATGIPNFISDQASESCPNISGNTYESFADYATNGIQLMIPQGTVIGTSEPATINCQIAGNFRYTVLNWGPADKKILIQLNGCEGGPPSYLYFPSTTNVANSTSFQEANPAYFLSTTLSSSTLGITYVTSGSAPGATQVRWGAGTTVYTGNIIIEDY